jgi:hypothetical protein
MYRNGTGTAGNLKPIINFRSIKVVHANYTVDLDFLENMLYEQHQYQRGPKQYSYVFYYSWNRSR